MNAPISRRTKRRKQRDLNLLRGIPNRVDATEARDHLNMLNQTMSWKRIGEVSGCSRNRLYDIGKGRVPEINRLTHDRILAIRPPSSSGDPKQLIDATGTRRRIQAMAMIGHSQDAIADAIGGSQWHIGKISMGASRMIRRRTADRIDAAYAELAQQAPEPSRYVTRCRNIAAAKGWRDPAFWEDMGRIDDPTFDPATADKPLGRFELSELRREEIEHLASYGYKPTQIRARINDELSLNHVREIVLAWRRGQKREREQVAA